MGMPMIEINTTAINSYINQAKNQTPPQYYTSQADFYSKTGFTAGSTKTFTGIVFIEGNFTLNQGRTMNLTGVLATSGSIIIGDSGTGSPFNGILNINRPAGQPAGVLSTGNFTLATKGDLTGNGLIFSAGTTIDSSTNTFTFTGGLLTDGKATFGARVINLHFDLDVINNTIGTPTTSPVIVINHWEEEY